MLQGKKIILGITGSIAAYKAAYLTRALIKKGAEVQIVITPAGKEFITPVTLSALTGKPVISEFFSANDGTWHSHVDLGLWADLLLIAPATASTIGKMANGIADNMLITTYLSAKAPVFVAPAMDLDMFAHPTTQHNLDLLRSFGNHIIEPATGELASHLEGKGRMEEPDRLVERIEAFFASRQSLRGRKIVITAGPTYEKIDPVRFIGNYSSGKMGYAIAGELADRGACVTLVTGRTELPTPAGVERVDVLSATEMYDAAVRAFEGSDGAVMCAAVADYTPDRVSDTKIKKCDGDMCITLRRTRDIAAELGAHKGGRLLVGFALETHDEQAHAEAKLEKKNFDFIVLNSLRDAGAGFRGDTNKVTFIDRTGREELPLLSKREVAERIAERIEEFFAE